MGFRGSKSACGLFSGEGSSRKAGGPACGVPRPVGTAVGALCLTHRSDPSLGEWGWIASRTSPRACRRRDRGVGQSPTALRDAVQGCKPLLGRPEGQRPFGPSAAEKVTRLGEALKIQEGESLEPAPIGGGFFKTGESVYQTGVEGLSKNSLILIDQGS